MGEGLRTAGNRGIESPASVPVEAIGPAALAREGSGGEAARALRQYLRRGLQKALAGPRLSEDDLDDFTHDAILRILEKLDSFRGESQFTTWAMAVAIRVAFTTLRSRRYRERVQNADFDSEQHAAPKTRWGDPTRRLERSTLLNVLDRAIHQELTERQRHVVLGGLRGTPSEEIASQLGITRNAFYKLYHDARKKLRARILAAGFTEGDVREELRGASEES